jgi:hypothetical protein
MQEDIRGISGIEAPTPTEILGEVRGQYVTNTSTGQNHSHSQPVAEATGRLEKKRKAKRSSYTGRKTKRLSARSNTKESEFSTTLPDEVKTNITSWKDDPLSFFVKGSDVNLELENCIGGFYSCLVSLESRQGLDSIRARFLKVSFYHLKLMVCSQQLRSVHMAKIARVIHASGLTSHDSSTIENKLSRWIEEGHRLDALCKDLSDEVQGFEYLSWLFLLPSQVNYELYIHR